MPNRTPKKAGTPEAMRQKLKNQADEVNNLTRALAERNATIKSLQGKNKKLVLQKEKLWKREYECKEQLKRQLSAAQKTVETFKKKSQQGEEAEGLRYQLMVANDEKQTLTENFTKLREQYVKLQATFETQRQRLARKEEQIAALHRQLGRAVRNQSGSPAPNQDVVRQMHTLTKALESEKMKNDDLHSQLDKATKRANSLKANLTCSKLLKGKSVDEIQEFKPRLSTQLTQSPVSAPGMSRNPSFSAAIDAVEIVEPMTSLSRSHSDSFLLDPAQTLSRTHSAPNVLNSAPMASLPAPISELNANSSPKMGPLAGSPNVVGSPPQTSITTTQVPAHLAKLGSSIWSDSKLGLTTQNSWGNLSSSSGASFDQKPKPGIPSRRNGSSEGRREPMLKPPKAPKTWDTNSSQNAPRRDSASGFPKVGSSEQSWSKPASAGWSSAWG